ncbi:La-related protein 1 [Orchesella cincta]|uniref:La-related protein 1 n=1 Tax=Orchesella cincta TaxID=48709 RepID=A0A1D2N939_ORCCI|nr:La-related protein 1 [Orchesella cincta]
MTSEDKDVGVSNNGEKAAPERQDQDDSDFVLVVNRKKHTISESHGYYNSKNSYRKYDDHECEYRRRRSADHRGREFRDNSSSGSRGHRKAKTRERERSENSSTNSQTQAQDRNGVLYQNKENIGVIKSFSLVVAGGSSAPESSEENIDKKIETASIPTSSNDTASLTSEEPNEFLKTHDNVVEYVEAPPPPVNPWFKNKATTKTQNHDQKQTDRSNNAKPSSQQKPLKQDVQKSHTSVKVQTEGVAVPKPQQTKKAPESVSSSTQTSSQALTQPKGPDIAQTREVTLLSSGPQVYYREMANGFRPGRGRGSYSASASRSLSARSLVLSQIKTTVKIHANEDWPSLGEAVHESSPPNGTQTRGSSTPQELNTDDVVKNEIAQPQTAQINSQTPNASKPAVGIIESGSENERVSTSSDDDNDESRNGSKRRPSKQRWVPLDITTETADQRNKPKGTKHTRDYRSHHQSRSKGKENVMNGYSDYSEHERLNNNNRMRGGGYRGRGGSRGGMRRHNNNVSRNSLNMINGIDVLAATAGADFTDYPPDFTTLTPMYPAVSEFIMPYVTNGYFPTPFSPPPVLVEHEPIPIAVNPVPVPVPAPVDNITMLIDLVRTQIEYYFSSENLEKDFYLRRKMDSDGYLPVHLIATFPRVKNMTQEYSIVISAIQGSENLELKADLSSVRTRINPTIWPLPDNSAVISTTVSSIDKEKESSASRVNNNELGSESLNPNVPEFVPQQHKRQMNAVAY